MPAYTVVVHEPLAPKLDFNILWLSLSAKNRFPVESIARPAGWGFRESNAGRVIVLVVTVIAGHGAQDVEPGFVLY